MKYNIHRWAMIDNDKRITSCYCKSLKIDAYYHTAYYTIAKKRLLLAQKFVVFVLVSRSTSLPPFLCFNT